MIGPYCPRCGHEHCTGPDTKHCSDNVIAKLMFKLSEAHRVKKLYEELMDNVPWTAPHETRHETALRMLRSCK